MPSQVQSYLSRVDGVKAALGALATLMVGSSTLSWANHKWMLNHFNTRLNENRTLLRDSQLAQDARLTVMITEQRESVTTALAAFDRRISGIAQRVAKNEGKITLLIQRLDRPQKLPTVEALHLRCEPRPNGPLEF